MITIDPTFKCGTTNYDGFAAAPICNADTSNLITVTSDPATPIVGSISNIQFEL